MNTANNGLIRIICLDAHIPGKCMAIKVEEHANLSGTNGAGKTTLLKLTPFFYGSSPTDVIPRKSTRTRFVDYYLPRPTSMIIYEYRTNRGLMCAVAYRHSSGEKPAYRFLAEGFSDDYFSEIREGKRCYAEGRELGRLWSGNHLEHSKQIEITTDYRAIIQGDAELINRTGDKELRKLAVQFSLSGKIGKMRYIDKMATAILGRSGNMERIKFMLADIMQEDNVVPPSLNLHRGIKNEIASLGILRDLDRNDALFYSVIAKGTSYQENAQAIGLTYSELALIKQQLSTHISEQAQALDAIRETLLVLSTDWEMSSEDLKNQIADAKANVNSEERQLDALNKANEAWENEDIHTKKAHYEQLEHLRDLSKAARLRLEQLEHGVEDIQRQYHENIAAENTRHHKVTDTLKDKIRDFEQSIASIREKWNASKFDIIQNSSREKDTIRQAYSAEIETLRDKIAAAKQHSQHTFFSEEEKTELILADASADEHRDRITQQETAYSNASQQQDTLNKQRQQADKTLSTATRSVDAARNKRDEMLLLCRPATGSLLAEFRDKQPLWHNTIGRVIRQELLTRKDLSPVFTNDTTNAHLGWQLDLNRIDKPEWATTLEEQERRLQLCEDELDQEIAYQQDCEKQLENAAKAFIVQRDITDEDKRQLSRQKKQLESALAAVKNIKQRNNDAAVGRRQAAKILMERLTRNKDEVMQRLEAAINSADERAQSAINEGISQTASEESRLDNEADAYRNSLEEESREHQSTLKTHKSDFDSQRSDRGLDQNVIREAELEVQSTNNKVREVEAYAKAIDKYENWINVEWANYETHTASLSEYTATRDKVIEQEARDKAEYKLQRDRLNDKKRIVEETLRGARTNSSECQEMMQRLTPPLTAFKINDARSLERVLSDAQMLLQEHIDLKQDIRKGVSKAESLILKGGDDSQIAKAWQSLVQVEKNKLSSTGENDIDEELLTLNKTLALDELLRVHLSQLRDSLSLFIENVGNQVIQYYLGMRDISTSINSQSRQISEAIGSTLHFDAISDVKVSLKSRIDNEDFWPILEKFYDIWRSWKENASGSLPPPEIDEQLLRATDILNRSNNNRPLSGLFDLEISLRENNRLVVARKAEELEDASSTGLSYLILCCIYAGISRMLCRDRSIKIHWPMDELGTLAAENITRLFAMLDEYGIVMIGGFPTTDPMLLQHFKFHHDVQRNGGIVEMSLPEDELEKAIAERSSAAIKAELIEGDL